MGRPGIISGRVRGPTGPVEDARVFFLAGPEPLPDIAALTDSNGKFSLAAPSSGNYQIQVVADGFSPKAVSAIVTEGITVNIEIKLKPDRTA